MQADQEPAPTLEASGENLTPVRFPNAGTVLVPLDFLQWLVDQGLVRRFDDVLCAGEHLGVPDLIKVFLAAHTHEVAVADPPQETVVEHESNDAAAPPTMAVAEQRGVARGKHKFSCDVLPSTLEELRDTARALNMPISSLVQASLDATLATVRTNHFDGRRAPSRHGRTRTALL